MTFSILQQQATVIYSSWKIWMQMNVAVRRTKPYMQSFTDTSRNHTKEDREDSPKGLKTKTTLVECAKLQLNMEHASCDVWSAVLVGNCQPSIQTRHDKHARPFNHWWTAPDRWSYVTKPQRCWGDVADSEASLPKLLLFWTHHFTAVQPQFILFEHCLHHKVIWVVHMYLLNITSNCLKIKKKTYVGKLWWKFVATRDRKAPT